MLNEGIQIMNDCGHCVNDFMDTICKNCTTIICCKEIDAPILLETEIDKIIRIYALQEEDFIIKEELNGKIIKRLKKINGFCKFWNPINKKCQIYNSGNIYDCKPFDCYLFPLDIIRSEGTYRWIIYDLCNGEKYNTIDNILDCLENHSNFKELGSILDSYAIKPLNYEFRLLKPVQNL